MYKKIVYSLLFLICNSLSAQGITAARFLLIHPSPNLNGMAGAYTALPTDDPYGFYFNPAQIAVFGDQNNFATGFYTSKSKYLPSFNFSDLTYHSVALAGGYNFANYKKKLPIRVGIGLIHTKLDLGENVWTDEAGNEIGKFHSYESYNGFSIGVGFKYFAEFNLGYTYKKISIDHGPFLPSDKRDDFLSEDNAHDLGILLALPIVGLYEDILMDNLSFFSLNPFLNYSVGTAFLNYGDELHYFDQDKTDPIPRLSKIGHALSFGFSQEFSKYEFNWLKIEYSSEAEDILIKRSPNGSSEYESFPGDIQPWKNIILNKTSGDICVRRGWNFELLESFKYSLGKFDQDRDYGYSFESNGFMISTQGLSKILYNYFDEHWIEFFVKHFDFRYMNSEYKSDEPDYQFLVKKFEGISVQIFGF